MEKQICFQPFPHLYFKYNKEGVKNMLSILKPSITYEEVASQQGQFLKIIGKPYQKLKEDFKMATHLQGIDDLNFKKVSGVYIKVNNEDDALLAAIFCYKKYAYDNELHPDFMDEDDYYDDYDYDKQWANDGTYCYLPIITDLELIHYNSSNPIADGPFMQNMLVKNDNEAPYWTTLMNPLIIHTNGTNLEEIKKSSYLKNRFYILMETRPTDYPYSVDFDSEVYDQAILTKYQQDFIFEADVEFVQITDAPLPYLVYLFQALAEQLDCKLSPSLNCEEIIRELIQYRGKKFETVSDLERILLKALRYSNNQTIEEHAFQRLFIREKVQIGDENRKEKAFTELDKLVGLENVKQQLKRLIDRMTLVEARKQEGYLNIDHHLAAVFMGNPGTAKTTVARIFGKTLFETKVLTNNVFVEVSRKDLVGKYVGWTYHEVEQVFQQAKGGTLFIDEAYSLLSSHDNFSEEALTAIIQNMENNPDTLVIFAGYTEQMIDFIRHSNPGMRSRLTNIVTFPDYDERELVDIFHYFINETGYELEDINEINGTIIQFIRKINHFNKRQIGNGRLIRKLLSTSIGYMAQRQPENINLLLISDVKAACQEIFEAELAIQTSRSGQTIGFSSSI